MSILPPAALFATAQVLLLLLIGVAALLTFCLARATQDHAMARGLPLIAALCFGAALLITLR